jgi:hypothetical protein
MYLCSTLLLNDDAMRCRGEKLAEKEDLKICYLKFEMGALGFYLFMSFCSPPVCNALAKYRRGISA